MSLSEFIYTTVLRPKPLKAVANAIIRRCIPDRMEQDGAVIVLNPNDPVVSGALALGVYEKPETKFFCKVCRAGMTFLDVGANIGYYSALAMVRIGAAGKVIALEPDPENFRYLQATVAANGAASATCIQKAAAAQSGILKLYVSKNNRGDNRLYPNDLCDRSYDVQVSTVDALLGECGVQCVDLVKIDVQGFEGHVLHGMTETIRRSADLIILTEFWPFGLKSAGSTPESVLLEMEEAGLTLYELTKNGSLAPLADKQSLIKRYPGRNYTNIVAVSGNALPPSVEVDA